MFLIPNFFLNLSLAHSEINNKTVATIETTKPMSSRKEKKEKCKKYLQENVNPILETLVVSILKDQPQDVVWLPLFV